MPTKKKSSPTSIPGLRVMKRPDSPNMDPYRQKKARFGEPPEMLEGAAHPHEDVPDERKLREVVLFVDELSDNLSAEQRRIIGTFDLALSLSEALGRFSVGRENSEDEAKAFAARQAARDIVIGFIKQHR